MPSNRALTTYAPQGTSSHTRNCAQRKFRPARDVAGMFCRRARAAANNSVAALSKKSRGRRPLPRNAQRMPPKPLIKNRSARQRLRRTQTVNSHNSQKPPLMHSTVPSHSARILLKLKPRRAPARQCKQSRAYIVNGLQRIFPNGTLPPNLRNNACVRRPNVQKAARDFIRRPRAPRFVRTPRAFRAQPQTCRFRPVRFAQNEQDTQDAPAPAPALAPKNRECAGGESRNFNRPLSGRKSPPSRL